MMLFDETALFDEGKKRFTKFDLPGADLRLWEQLFNKAESDNYFRLLKKTTPWQQRTRKMYDKWVLDPRHSSGRWQTSPDRFRHLWRNADLQSKSQG